MCSLHIIALWNLESRGNRYQWIDQKGRSTLDIIELCDILHQSILIYGWEFALLHPTLASQVTTSLCLPHTDCSRCRKETPSPAKSYTTAPLPDQKKVLNLTVTTPSRSVIHSTKTTWYYGTSAKNWFCFCLKQKNEAVMVDGEVATILSQTRFKEDFTCQPPGGTCEPCGAPKVSGCFSSRSLRHPYVISLLRNNHGGPTR